MFELETPTKTRLSSVNPRAERHGEELIPAVDLKFTMEASNDILSYFHGGLKSFLYFKSEASSSGQTSLDGVDPVTDLPNLRFPQFGSSIKWDDERTGYTLTIDFGLGEKSNLVLDGCAVNQFSIDPKEGGTVEIGFRVQSTRVPEPIMGKLTTLVQHDLQILLTPPDTGSIGSAE